jgi:hypothetical protein
MPRENYLQINGDRLRLFAFSNQYNSLWGLSPGNFNSSFYAYVGDRLLIGKIDY